MSCQFADRMSLVKPSAIRELLKHAADPAVISFGGGFPDPDIFPQEALAKVAERVMKEDGKQALQYAATEGLPSLREKICKRMARAGIQCGLENLFLTQGGQQGLDIVCKMFINPGDVIIVENPTFLGALAAFNPCMPAYKSVPLDENGMKMDALEEVLKSTLRAKFIYTIPEFQNPTGVTMSLANRKRLVELANQYDVMILEDSPYREIRYEGEPLPAIKSFDTQERVIHLGSFSKILCPGIRLGWLVAKPELATKLALLKMAADTQNSTLNMFIVDRFMDMYDIDAHIESIRKIYKTKKDLMLDTIKSEFPKEITYTNPSGGLFTWLTMPESWDAGKIMGEELLPKEKVAYVPGAPFYACDVEANHARMNYSCMSSEKIVEGITKIGNVFKSML